MVLLLISIQHLKHWCLDLIVELCQLNRGIRTVLILFLRDMFYLVHLFTKRRLARLARMSSVA